jgi:hypothetical protein
MHPALRRPAGDSSPPFGRWQHGDKMLQQLWRRDRLGKCKHSLIGACVVFSLPHGVNDDDLQDFVLAGFVAKARPQPGYVKASSGAQCSFALTKGGQRKKTDHKEKGGREKRLDRDLARSSFLSQPGTARAFFIFFDGIQTSAVSKRGGFQQMDDDRPGTVAATAPHFPTEGLFPQI